MFIPSDDGAGKTKRVYIQAQDVGLERPLDSTVHDVPFSEAPIVVLGRRHKARGTVSGFIVPRGIDGEPGTTVSVTQWLNRLDTLIANQVGKTIVMHHRDFTIPNVRLAQGYTLDFTVSSKMARVSIPWWEI